MTQPHTPINQLEDLRDELTILYFILRCNQIFVDVKLGSICDYINKCHPEEHHLTCHPEDCEAKPKQDVGITAESNSCLQFVRTCLKYFHPTEDDFYHALDNMVKKPKQTALDLLHQALKISISDGGLNHEERLYLSEIVQTYREHNLHPNLDF